VFTMPKIMSPKAIGILFGILAGAMWSIEAIIGKTLLPSLSFMQVAASEAFFASITSLAYVLLSRKPLLYKDLSKRHINCWNCWFSNSSSSLLSRALMDIYDKRRPTCTYTASLRFNSRLSLTK